MTITNQGLSIEKIEHIITQRVASEIKTIAIYDTKTRVAHELMNQTKRQEDKMEENAKNKRKWVGDHGGSSSQNKEHRVIRTHVVGPSNNKVDAGKLPHCNRIPVAANNQRAQVTKQKTKVTCYECGRLEHYKSDCPKWKNQNQVNKQWKGKTHRESNVMAYNANA
ncbi:reverse transcriptase domain-containing protein [Tanacetum coccineum]